MHGILNSSAPPQLDAGFTAQAADSLQDKPDFTGKWVLERVEGNIDLLMADNGLSWPLRKMARRVKYGVGRQFQEISQNGDYDVSILRAGFYKAVRADIRVGGGDQQILTSTGKTILANFRWEGSALRMDAKTLTGAWLPSQQRHLVGSRMVLENVTSKGGLVRRYFVRKREDGINVPDVEAFGSDDEDAMHVDGIDEFEYDSPRVNPVPGRMGRAGSTTSCTTYDSEASISDSEPYSPEARARPGFPDLSGRWVLDRIDGDIDALLVDAGVSWAMRRMAQSYKYGVGRLIQDIEQDGDEFKIVNEGGTKVSSMTFRAGAPEQEIIGHDGVPMMASFRWDEGALRMTARKLDGSRLPSSARFIENSQMVSETTTSKGGVVRRYHKRLL